AVALGLAAFAADATSQDKTKPDKEKQVRERLARLEKAVKHSATHIQKGIARKKHIEITRAAQTYARLVAGNDDTKFVQVFKATPQAGLGPTPGAAPAAGVDRLRLLRMPSTPAGGAHGGRLARSINQDRNYQKNLKTLIKESLDPDSGLLPPSVRIVGGVLD